MEENDKEKKRKTIHHHHHHHSNNINDENQIPPPGLLSSPRSTTSDSFPKKSVFVEKGFITEEEREGLKNFFLSQKEKHIQSSSRDYSYKIMQLRRLSLFHHCDFIDDSQYEDLYIFINFM